ncbi:hypothetical protein PL81_18085 [Streptomyces sp. RSD-27]|nr:hypothetical protein PL81_18085 [Streptomyces sp. RSD-27]
MASRHPLLGCLASTVLEATPARSGVKSREFRVADQRHMGVEPTADPPIQFARDPGPAETTSADRDMGFGPPGCRTWR